MKVSPTGIVVSALPSFLMAGLFYSLAIHIHQSLGGWPASIGERGFSASLITHAAMTDHLFVALFLCSIFVVPVAICVCLFVWRFRGLIPYLLLYEVIFFLCWGLMQLAPEPFLNWWRD